MHPRDECFTYPIRIGLPAGTVLLWRLISDGFLGSKNQPMKTWLSTYQ